MSKEHRLTSGVENSGDICDIEDMRIETVDKMTYLGSLYQSLLSVLS